MTPITLQNCANTNGIPTYRDSESANLSSNTILAEAIAFFSTAMISLEPQTDITGAQASSYLYAITSDSIDGVQATVQAILFRLSISPHDVKGYRYLADFSGLSSWQR
jgi:hypothetical protein